MSDLLNAASLVMIPSGYSEDKVYSEVPTDGNGDLSFTRASNGTRINSAGLVEVTPWNLLQNSEDFSVQVFVNATIGSNVITAPNGTTTADSLIEDSVNGAHAVYNFASITFVAGVYTLSCYAKKGTRDWLRFQFYDGIGTSPSVWVNVNTGVLGTTESPATSTITSVGNGWYRISITTTMASVSGGWAVYSSTGDGLTAYAGTNGASALYLWGVQINNGSTAKPYFPTTDRLNVPRLTYQNGGGGCPSLLLEKQSTNYAQYSEDFSNGFWTKDTTTTITANDAISPDGTQNADRFESPSPSKGIYSYGVSGSETISVYIKAGNSSNVGKSAVLFTTTATQDFILTNDWQRISVSGAASSLWALYPTATNSFTNVLIWGAQAEGGSYPTSYIPTTSASATRVADTCSKTGISSLIGQTEGVLFIDLIASSYNADGTSYSLLATLGNSSENIQIYTNNAGLYYNITATTVADASTGITLINGGRYKIAIAYKSGDSAVFVNGSLTNTTAKTTMPTAANFYLNEFSAGTYKSSNSFNQAILFKTRLTNAECIALTTI